MSNYPFENSFWHWSDFKVKVEFRTGSVPTERALFCKAILWLFQTWKVQIELLENGAMGIVEGKPTAIEDIPSPDWTHFHPRITSYDSNLKILLPRPGISMWTRGCPWHCIFCANPVFGSQPTRYRPADNVAEDMAQLKRLGVRNIYIYDDELFGVKQPDGWLSEIADRIAPLGLRWITQGRCSKKYITAELLNDAKRAGCHTIFWGVESFSQRVLDTIKKGTDVEDIWHTLRTARQVGFNNAVFLMVGNYTETDDDLAITAAALAAAYQEGLIQMRQTTICTPMPGTKLAELAQAEGWYHEPPETGPQMLQYSSTPWLSVDRMKFWLREFDSVCPVGLA